MDKFKYQLERILALVTIGSCRAIREKSLSIDEANDIIFSPYTIDLLSRNNINETLINLIHLGSELEDVESIIPEKFSDSLREIEEGALKFISELPNYDYEQQDWIKNISTEVFKRA